MSLGSVHSEVNGGATAGGDLASVLPREGTRTECRLEDVRPEGVAIGSLDAGTSLILHTCHSEYRLTVLDGARGDVLVQGGLLLPDDAEAFLLGSASSGGALYI